MGEKKGIFAFQFKRQEKKVALGTHRSKTRERAQNESASETYAE